MSGGAEREEGRQTINYSPSPSPPLRRMEGSASPSSPPPPSEGSSVTGDAVEFDMKELFGDDSEEEMGDAQESPSAALAPANEPLASLDSDEDEDLDSLHRNDRLDNVFRSQIPPKRILVAAKGPERTVSLPVTFAYSRNKSSLVHTEPDFLRLPPGQRPILKPEFRYATLPNVIGVQDQPFDPATFDVNELPSRRASGTDQQKSTPSEMGIESRMLPVSTIRWKLAQTEPGGPRRPVSNTRLVKWSDGSVSLRVGEEHFEVLMSDIHSEEFIFNIPESNRDIAEFAKQIDGSMQINPAEGSMDRSSAAQIIRSVEENNQLAATTREMVFAENPEESLARARQREKEMEQMMRRQKRKEEKLRRTMMERRGRLGTPGSRSLDASFLEGEDAFDDDEGNDNLEDEGEVGYESDDEDARRMRARMSERSEASAAEKAELAVSRKRKKSDDEGARMEMDETGSGGQDEGDDQQEVDAEEQEEEFELPSASSRLKRRRILLSDDEDED